MTELNLNQFAQTHREPQWLLEKREMAQKLQKHPVPEEFTPQRLDLNNYAPPEAQKQGIIIMDLLSAPARYSNLLQENLMEKCFVWNHDRSALQHMANLQTGAFIYIPNGAVYARPLEVGPRFQQTAAEKHLLIIAGANSNATVVYSSGRPNGQKSREITEILTGNNAHLNYYDSATTNIDRNRKGLFAYLARHSQLDAYTALFNRKRTYYQSRVDLNGEHSKVNLNLISLSNGHQQQTIQNYVTNNQDNTTGNINQRGIVAGHGSTHCRTIGKIIEGAKRTQSYQSAKLLTLDHASHGEVDPLLLIRDNDVSAGHSASIGKVNRQQLYYLETRGLDRRVARWLLTRSYLMPLIDHFPKKPLRDRMIKQLEARIHD